MRNKIELLAPAGSIQVMKACFSAGADAVYMGLSRFSARAFADNAGTIEYAEALDYAHLRGKKLYLTLNTLLKEKELEKEIRPLLDPLYSAGLDGIIVQDPGLMRLLKREYPLLPLHISTQAAVTGPGSAKIWKEAGASRVVPARELSLREIREIREESGLEVECFIHGALCYSYSGQCLFSSVIGGRSGNRGRCAQSCRMPYDLFDEEGRQLNPKKQQYLLSLKDLNTVELLPEIIFTGADSLKIEGRMKKAEYAAGVTAVYRKYLDLLQRLTEETGSTDPAVLRKAGYRVEPEDLWKLYDLFNRSGFTDGYFKRHNSKEMVTLLPPAFREENEDLNEEIRSKYIRTESRCPVTIRYFFEEGKPGRAAFYTVVHGREFSAECVSDVPVETALSSPSGKSSVEKQLSKLGDTPFLKESIEGELRGNVFLPVSLLNDLRRKTAALLTEKILSAYRREAPKRRDRQAETTKGGEKPAAPAMRLEALVSSREQFEEAEKSAVSAVFIESTISEAGSYREFTERAKTHSKQVFLALPQVIRDTDSEWFIKNAGKIGNAGFDGFLIRSLESLSLLDSLKIRGERIADYTLYVFNREARAFFTECGFSSCTVSVELSAPEIRDADFSRDTILLYGRLPMMVSANCLLKSTAGCDRKNRVLALSDRMGNRLPVQCICRSCMNRILNSVPLSLLSLYGEVGKLGIPAGRLDFTTEGREETKKVLALFEKAYLEGEDAGELSAFTRGHFRKKTE